MNSKVKLLITYDGTEFAGWQKQKQSPKPTVQGTLEQMISKLFAESVRVIGASRTDAGVHALGQVAHFVAPKQLNNYNLMKSLNAMAPAALAVRNVWLAPDDFHAIASSNGKTYRYLIRNSPLRAPLQRERSLWEPRPLDLDRLNTLTKVLIGTHDFKSFQSAGSVVPSTIRTIYKAEWQRRNPSLVEFSITGSGFLKQMVRNIVGTLLSAHHNAEPAEIIQEILNAQDRRQARGTAAPQGLYLVKVHYPKELDIRCRNL